MTVIEILDGHLRLIGADGLCTAACGCGLGDLAPCREWVGDCTPASRVIATEAGEYHDAGDQIYVPMPNAPVEGRA